MSALRGTPNIRTFDDATSCAHFLGERISAHLTEWNGDPTLLLLSGGSAFRVLPFITADDWQTMTVTMLDERFERDPSRNNFCQLRETPWYESVRARGGTFISTAILPEDTLEGAAEHFETSLRSFQTRHQSGHTIALFGMGQDGHTAGIFPFPEDPTHFESLFDSSSLVTAYEATGKNSIPLRFTTTFTFHRTIDAAFVFIDGDEKQPAFEALLRDANPRNEIPARIFHDLPLVTIGTTLHL